MSVQRAKKAILIALATQLAVSVFAASRVTVDQLNAIVTTTKGERDSKIAGRLAGMELTERLSASKLAVLESSLPGQESRRALLLLADQATFLNPPEADIPKDPPPSFEQQRVIIAKAIEYVKSLQLKLPNMFAQRDTIHFEDTPPGLKLGSESSFNPAQPLHPVSRTSATVLYRDGQDFVQVNGKEQPATTQVSTGLSSFGEFGPILSTVLIDLPQGKLAWSHWEQGAKKRIAVFAFSVPKAASHYAVRFCCVGTQPIQQFSGYRGQMTINPLDGTILRLTLIADLAKNDPVTQADLMVEYGPVKLGGNTYFCPTKSISLSLAADQSNFRGAKIFNGAFVFPAEDLSQVPKQIMLNEVVYDQYHLFQSDARILMGTDPKSSSAQVTAANPSAAPVESSASATEGRPPISREDPAPAESIADAVATAKMRRLQWYQTIALLHPLQRRRPRLQRRSSLSFRLPISH